MEHDFGGLKRMYMNYLFRRGKPYLVFSIVFMLNIPLLSCQEKAFDIGDWLAKKYPGYKVVETIEGHFRTSENKDYLAFLYDPRQHIDQSLPAGIQKVIMVGKNEKGEVIEIDLGLRTLGYREKELKVMEKFSEAIGSKSKMFPVADLNGNGIDELYFLGKSGIGSTLIAKEYTERNGFQFLLGTGEYTKVVTKIDFIPPSAVTSLGIKVFGLGNVDTPKGTRDWYLFQWDTKSTSYAVVSKGFSEWDGKWWEE